MRQSRQRVAAAFYGLVALGCGRAVDRAFYDDTKDGSVADGTMRDGNAEATRDADAPDAVGPNSDAADGGSPDAPDSNSPLVYGCGGGIVSDCSSCSGKPLPCV